MRPILLIISLALASVVRATPPDSIATNDQPAGQYPRASATAFAIATQTICTEAAHVLTRVAVTNTLKKTVHEWRPDGSEDNSFPSRHAVWAYGMAASAVYYAGEDYPLAAIIAHTGANVIGQQRVIDRRHWPGDVMAGAGMGIALSIGVNALSSKIFNAQSPLDHDWWSDNPECGSVTSGTDLAIPLRRDFGEYRLGTGFTSKLRGTLSISDHFGLSANADMSSAPVGTPQTDCSGVLNSVGLGIGPTFTTRIADSRVGVAVTALGGYRKYFGKDLPGVNWGSPAGQADITLSLALSSRLDFGIGAGYRIESLSIDSHKTSLSAITCGFSLRSRL